MTKSPHEIPSSLKPSYLSLPLAELWERVKSTEALLKSCTLCPRECRGDRTAGQKGFCRTGDTLLVSSWGPHFGEERPLVGRFGSGTIFFSNCNLGCVFCQNWDISQTEGGELLEPEQLAEIMLQLQSSGCHNINLVTPTHQIPMILRALVHAIERGLEIPIVYNCGGYESLTVLKLLDKIIDIYMPDMKYADSQKALMFSKAECYGAHTKAALKEMHRQVGDLKMDLNGVAYRGLLVRHLVLPEGNAGTEEVVRFLAEEISKETYINIMDQYRPCYKALNYAPLKRRITKCEYEEALQLAHKAGLRRIDGFTD